MSLVIPRESSDVISCRDCSRLLKYQAQVKDQRSEYWCTPASPWGSKWPRVMVVGLAPGLAGAGRTAQSPAEPRKT